MLGLLKGGKSLKKCERTKGYELRLVNKQWKLNKASSFPKALFLQIPLGVPPSTEIRMFLPSRYREGTSPVRVLGSALGATGEVREPFMYLPFLEFLHLKIFAMLVAIFCGSMSRTPSEIKVKHYSDRLRWAVGY